MPVAAAWVLALAVAAGQSASGLRILAKSVPEAASLNRLHFKATASGTAEHTPAVVILDNGASPAVDQACIEEELSAALPRLGRIPVYAVFGARPDLLYRANMSNGLELGLLTPLPVLKKACDASPEQRNPVKVPTSRIVPTFDLFRSLARHYSGKGPLRVFWLASDFTPYDWRLERPVATRRGSPPDEAARPQAPSIVEYLAEPFSAASITVFPLVVLRNPDASHARKRLESASYLAAATGGEAALATAERGQALRGLIDESEKYSIVQLEPETPPKDKEAGRLRLRPGAERFAVYPSSPPFERETPEQTAIRAVGYDSSFTVGSGCPDTSLEGSFFHLRLPPAQNDSTNPLFIHVEYVRPGQPTLRQRLVLQRPGPMCIPISDDGPGNSCIIVVYDEATGWTGARRANLIQKKPKP